MKAPTPDARNLPVCFGLSYDRETVVCRQCAAMRACSKVSLRWATRPSLAERLLQAQQALAPGRIDVTRLEVLYGELYRAHFGRAPRLRRSTRNDAIFGRLLAFLLKEEIDPTTFISANMEMLRESCERSTYGFQPNMLSGEKARARYNIYLRRANRRAKRGRADVFAGATVLGQFRVALAVSEAEVASYFVHSGLSGSPVTWERAIDASSPSQEWLDVRANVDRFHGAFDLAKERELATLTAAVAVSEEIATGLSTRIGYDTWSWESYRTLVCRLYPRTKRRKIDVSDVPGLSWRRSG